MMGVAEDVAVDPEVIVLDVVDTLGPLVMLVMEVEYIPGELSEVVVFPRAGMPTVV